MCFPLMMENTSHNVSLFNLENGSQYTSGVITYFVTGFSLTNDKKNALIEYNTEMT